jgi:nitrilase
MERLPEQCSVCCIQMCSGVDRDANQERAAQLLGEAAERGAKLAVLPENFAFMGTDDAEKRAVAESQECSGVLQFLSGQAKEHSMLIVGGTVALQSDRPPGMRNASPVFAPDGQLLAVYDKMHLFDVTLPKEQYVESDLIVAGELPIIIESDPWKLGLSVCYDLRFPELFRHYSLQGCQILAVPSAFTVPTGMAHWEPLLRARAIENQCYVLAAAQSGTHPGGRKTWGHSMIIDPWGDVLATEETDEGVVMAEISMQFVRQVRQALPALSHRRM